MTIADSARIGLTSGIGAMPINCAADAIAKPARADIKQLARQQQWYARSATTPRFLMTMNEADLATI